MTIRERGVERVVSAEEAFLLQLHKRASEGDGSASRAANKVLEELTDRPGAHLNRPLLIITSIVSPGSVTRALLLLRMGKKLDPYRETARILLEPWLVEAALARLTHPFSPAEQRIIVKATRTPHKVRWPEWWTEFP